MPNSDKVNIYVFADFMVTPESFVLCHKAKRPEGATDLHLISKRAWGQSAAFSPLGSLVAVAHLSSSQCEHIADLDRD